jgi:hypothetical protein
MEQSSSDANTAHLAKNLPVFLGTRTFQSTFNVYKSPPFIPFLSHKNQIHTHPPYFLKANFSIIFALARNFSTRALHDFRPKLRTTCPAHVTSFSFPATSSRSRPNSFPYTLFSKTVHVLTTFHNHTQQQIEVLIQIKYETVNT